MSGLSSGRDASAGNSKIVDIPDGPTVTSLTRIDLGATVAFTNATTGGIPTSYTVTSVPGGFTGTGSSSPINVTGLTSGTVYAFKVKGINSTGTGLDGTTSSETITAASASWILASTVNSTTNYTVPSGVSQVAAFVVGGGNAGSSGNGVTQYQAYSSGTGGNGGTGGAGGSGAGGIVNVTTGQTILATVGGSGGGTSSFGSYINSTGSGNVSITNGNGAGNGGSGGDGGTGGQYGPSGGNPGNAGGNIALSGYSVKSSSFILIFFIKAM